MIHTECDATPLSLTTIDCGAERRATEGVREVVAGCLSAVGAYYDSGRSPRALGVMAAAVRDQAGRAARLGLDTAEIDELILRPIEGLLARRFGPEAGGRINAEFAAAWEGRLAFATEPGRVPIGRGLSPTPALRAAWITRPT